MRKTIRSKILACFFPTLFCLVMVMVSCETDPEIYLPSNPRPLIYGIFNSNDTIHYLKVGKSFGADIDPKLDARIYDSLYFNEVKVSVFRSVNGDPSGSALPLTRITNWPKDSGYFHFPGQIMYQFDDRLKTGVYVSVEVPGLPKAEAYTRIARTGIIYQPDSASMYVYLVPQQAWLIQWGGNPWNEIDVSFEFIEDYGDSVFNSQYVHIQKTNYFESEYEKYREMKVTYEEFIREVLQQITPNDKVKQVFLGYISITIHGGDENMVNYIKYKDGFNDFGVVEFSNVTNGIGLLASRSTELRDSLRFDYSTRQQLINENRLRILKISKWN
ncbi:MAG: hypothetical protein HN352_01720 [Bacteroidetes bacterium]|jgi:hypothetical protein|nr:hypothetical protein [Bacteroidota bacterium]MBT4398584.1 hypothetical protein [Bacteroidota bacterium]MBT4409095.1 hypothetical protein [Bacteroidota bacterium]MBT5424809.1 hypothetical protein [Bacteroidota bacterium]MBT7092342.1 hypothetical protein [Bacteroidota bacterium]